MKGKKEGNNHQKKECINTRTDEYIIYVSIYQYIPVGLAFVAGFWMTG